MTPYEPNDHHRRSIRLMGYDYAQAGPYFVTICTQGRQCLFGDAVDAEMRMNDPGRMVRSVWDDLPGHYPGVEIDAFVIMPNHIHGIVVLVGAGPRACPDMDARPRGIWQPQGDGQPQGVAPTEDEPWRM